MLNLKNRLNNRTFSPDLYLLVVGVACACFSTGYLYPDEHFQIIEFANALIGRGDFKNLAWEYGSQIRPWLQPWLAAIFLKIGFWLSDSPFEAIKVVKLFFASLLCIACVYYCRSDGSDIDELDNQERRWGRLFLPTSALLAQMIGRTSSESFGTVWLFLCLGYMAKTFTSKRSEGAVQHLVCGAFCALMFYSRFQMGFVYAAIGIWLLIVRRSRPLHLIANLSGFFIIAVACTALDSWLYGDFVLTPYRYFKSNILEGVASNFGVSPWYGYFVEFNSTFRAITGSLSFISMGALLWKRPKSILAWIFWAFVIGHSLVAHKEERFLFPVLMLAPMSWTYGIEVLENSLQRVGLRPINRTSICRFLIITNCLVGLVWATRPFKRYAMLKELDTEARRNRQTICVNWDVPPSATPSTFPAVPGFYHSPALKIIQINDLKNLEESPNGCAALKAFSYWYEIRKMPTVSYLNRIIVEDGRRTCVPNNFWDRVLLKNFGKENLQKANQAAGQTQEQLFWWKCSRR